jgi:hypothetical protein
MSKTCEWRKKTKKVVKWILVKLLNENEAAHGRWTMLHNDGIQNFGQNFNFRSKHTCVLKQNWLRYTKVRPHLSLSVDRC